MTAADRIEDLARKATRGPWFNPNPLHGGYLLAKDAGELDTMVAKNVKRDDLNYITHLQPARGLAIARVLRAVASRPWIDSNENQCRECGLEQCINGKPTTRHESSCEYSDLDAALAALEAMEEA